MRHLVTGATGNVGSLVVERLLARGERPRVFVCDREKALARFGDRVDVAVGDLEDARSLAAALDGVDVLFLVTSGPELAKIDAAAAAVAKEKRVGRLVKLSSLDAREQNVGTGVWHAEGEAAVRASGIRFTFVQPSGFMANALYWARAIKTEGVVRSATGDGEIAFIHSDDIAAVATEAMTSEAYDGASLDITGPEALSYGRMTRMIGAALGKTIRYEVVTDEEARKQQIAWNAPPAMVEARLSIFRAIREGRLSTVTDTFERVVGRAPAAFDRWVEENCAAFR